MLETLKAPLRRFRLYRGLRFAWHFATDGVFRADHILRLRRPGNLFQYRSFTAPDRYPEIFSFVERRLASVPRPRVLSFGCATGEEVFTLRNYLPGAAIRGVDINARDIALCNRRLAAIGDPGIEFAVADSADGEPAESMDAIFCMAVFQHSALKDPTLRTCERHIRFDAFERTLEGLARCLKPGGLLAIRHADVRFTDAAVGAEFVPVMRLSAGGMLHPRFDRDNRRLPDEADTDVVFQKRPLQAEGRAQARPV